MLRHARLAASPLAHDSACTSNNNGEWIGLLPRRAVCTRSCGRGTETQQATAIRCQKQSC